VPRRYSLQGRRRRPTATRPSRANIQEKTREDEGTLLSVGVGSRSSTGEADILLAATRRGNYLKVDHMEGASMLKLKREMEKRYGGRTFDVTRITNIGSLERGLASLHSSLVHRGTREESCLPI
jgi:hypothetical protein